MKKILTFATATILLAGCTNKDSDLTFTIDSSTPNSPQFVTPASIPASQAIAYNFSLSNGTCTNSASLNLDGSPNDPAPASGDTYRSDGFNVANSIFAFAGCSSGTIVNISFNGGETLSYTVP